MTSVAIAFPTPDLTDGVITLRPWRDSDAVVKGTWGRDPLISRWTGVAAEYSEEKARAHNAAAEEERLAGRGLAMAIADAHTDELLGAIDLRLAGEALHRGELGYLVDRAARGRGVTGRAIKLMADWAVQGLGLSRIEAFVHPENIPSIKVLERLAFTREGLLRRYRPGPDGFEDRLVFSRVYDNAAAPVSPSRPTYSSTMAEREDLHEEIRFDENGDGFIGLYVGIEDPGYAAPGQDRDMSWDSYKGFARTSGPWRLSSSQASLLQDTIGEYLATVTRERDNRLTPFGHCHYCGASYGQVEGWPRTCGRCGSVAYRSPDPVSVVLVPVGDGLLGVQRSIAPIGLALPGGFIENGEAWPHAGAREVREETGLEVDPDGLQLLDTLSAPDGTLLVFAVSEPVDESALALVANDEVSELAVIAEASDDIVFDLHRQVIERYFASR